MYMSDIKLEPSKTASVTDSDIIQSLNGLNLSRKEESGDETNSGGAIPTWTSQGTIANPSATLADTIPLLVTCVNELTSATEIAVNLEGINLCRDGRLCLLQLYAKDATDIWVVDIVVLGKTAFDDHQGTAGNSLRSILEDPQVTKLFFDCRNDCDALFHEFDRLTPKRVYDVQVQEVARRQNLTSNYYATLIQGLKKTLQIHLPGRSNFKDKGAKLFSPELGGTYEVFKDRPLRGEVLDYAAADVAIMFELSEILSRGLRPGHEAKILKERANRAKECHDPGYQPDGPQKRRAPVW